MANTTSAKKMARKIERRTEVNKSRRSRMRSYLRKVEEAITGGDHGAALTALQSAEPELMRAAQKGIVPSQYRVPQGVAARDARECA